MLHRVHEDWRCLAIAAVAECDRDVAKEAATLRALDRALTKTAAKSCIVERHQIGHERHQLGRDGFVEWLVPRADFLTDVASENPVAELGAQLARNRSAIFDGE